MKNTSILILVLVLLSCKNEPVIKPLSATEIINKAIAVSGGNDFSNSIIKFDFRAMNYKAVRSNNSFELSRLQIKDGDTILDVFNNDGVYRTINTKVVSVHDSMSVKYKASVNSVHYFSVLPYGLNDKAVNKKLLGEEQVKTKKYYKIEVTFSADGGGEDYEDVFVYWIDKELLSIDYLAYSYNEKDGVGMRFREAYNERYINNLRFVDYNNYKTENALLSLQDLGNAFENNQLKLLSKIELNDIQVNLIDN